MEVFEKINYLINEKNMTKKEFADKFLSLNPKLRTTGEAPSYSSIYGYLSGRREIKIELIPYIAEALNVKEQELFNFDLEYSTEFNIRYSKDVREIINLLQYAPKNMIEHIKLTLQKFKKSYEDGVKEPSSS
ncbi:XRE family transcriptional regulator [Sulfurimonas sp. CVO]|uniref:helix-turn-helix domain-containing protein n=1 Tax=Sulfurimonas sp. CVO TaxID=2283483 RepID=UPI00132F3C95|nr:helix-turn-helix transcriptional regulator [Sulfurimonas sp. CVO]QHG91781.1 XRE family transcriptional regulator [Sulfurimonas sp. CVO]